MKRDPKWTGFYVEHEPVDVFFDSEPSRTRQEFAEECDINTIMARYERTGVISHVDPRAPVYLDASESPRDLQHALEILATAETAFMSLPAGVRKEFDNDVHAFVAYAEDPGNLARMREWGLAPPEPVPNAPMRVEVVNPPAGSEAP